MKILKGVLQEHILNDIFYQRKLDVSPYTDIQMSAVTGAVMQQQLCSTTEAASLPPSISMSEAPGPPPHPPLLLLLPAPCIKKRHCRLEGGRVGEGEAICFHAALTSGRPAT